MKNLLREHVWFPNLDSIVENEVNNSMSCNVNTKSHSKFSIKPSVMPERSWEELSIDFYGPFYVNNHLLVLFDNYSRYPIVERVNGTSSKSTIECLENVFSKFGYPAQIQSDNGPPFNSRDFAEYLRSNNITHRKITPYWPQANCLVERFMKNIGKSLRSSWVNKKIGKAT